MWDLHNWDLGGEGGKTVAFVPRICRGMSESGRLRVLRMVMMDEGPPETEG